MIVFVLEVSVAATETYDLFLESISAYFIHCMGVFWTVFGIVINLVGFRRSDGNLWFNFNYFHTINDSK